MSEKKESEKKDAPKTTEKAKPKKPKYCWGVWY